mmetsp:Transcript_104141/g.212477  ORF Transcript_104141/g.212477 Transcript_104141/m.212477 type:complete len:108 (-) Transcript_104141:379-702(-)
MVNVLLANQGVPFKPMTITWTTGFAQHHPHLATCYCRSVHSHIYVIARIVMFTMVKSADDALLRLSKHCHPIACMILQLVPVQNSKWCVATKEATDVQVRLTLSMVN